MNIETQTNNKRIAQNTILLYIRMIVITLISLYTSRIVLRCLGVSDYGIFNVVGGVIGILNYINALLAGGTSRFLTVQLGVGNVVELKKTFSTAFLLCLTAAFLIFLFGETIGLWFVNSQLNIDSSRMVALNWVYQAALFTSALTVVQSPFSASVISHEKMNVYAIISIIDAVIKLVLVTSLSFFGGDKLIIYSIMLLGIAIANAFMYQIYCRRCFEETTVSPRLYRDLIKDMFTYSGWNMIGAFAGVLTNYGVNIVLNIFFGTVVNAGRGVALQINGVVQQFYTNFQLASRPQIFKYYAQGKNEEMFKLMRNNSKYSAMLLLLILVPVAFNIDGLLSLWLGIVPEYTKVFVWLSLAYCFFCAIEAPMGFVMHAVGKMKLPNCVNSIMNLTVFPLSYISFKCGLSPYWGSVYTALVVLFSIGTDFWMLKKLTNGFSASLFIKDVLVPVIKIIIICCVLPVFLTRLAVGGIIDTLLICMVDFLYVSIVVFYLGLSKQMRAKLINNIYQKCHIVRK